MKDALFALASLSLSYQLLKAEISGEVDEHYLYAAIKAIDMDALWKRRNGDIGEALVFQLPFLRISILIHIGCQVGSMASTFLMDVEKMHGVCITVCHVDCDSSNFTQFFFF
ncbi:uncharacterized protein LOC114278486 isoform X2 [Camellia sinensis]|uniref:uncharacterized protein LOC114278486 isoform X2 n=1 Tax=Camellia sinensis TaxID=4442 RepID=UPI001035BCC4|nr:uncharacterized protein LOC114278486 isoform X2 [Camellia sinensis]XP_028076340.1 uncharacterized protein LOC114278486 isoform X2 [Camellia sinensis]XP_028076341.1 uncharacterized protein LOC114278486 isoform X2 [Camellia sinensis]XP_028076342.1 uncharacterized protein LOC114278486 isoform X2 [Camellia sinensis]XP_028076343.1 uncharacterized protein LOC114278486 isoform X2 [Camellia sinensis]XP_028076344.1 uncharacterized protein LOC114278486 isoform X2 [Camellia sinensis]XP_028076345.1 un